MSIPRLNMSFGPGDTCSPFSNCSQRDSLINLISSLQFEEDGYMNSMGCPESGGSYVLLCKSFYDNFFRMESLPQSPSLIGEDHLAHAKTTSTLMILLLVCVLVIIGLCLTNFVNIRKVKKYQSTVRILERNTFELPEAAANGIENP